MAEMEPKAHYAINPDPYRVRALAMTEDENLKVRALAGVVVTLCDAYDEMKAVLGIETGQIVEWPGG